VAELVPPLDKALTEAFVDEFISLEGRFIQRDWQPAQLDGEQFCEVLGRIIYHQDSGTLSPAKQFDECAKYVEDEKNQHTHAMNPRHDALNVIKVLRTTYKFRSQQGGVHISPTYKPNHMDSKVIVEMIRWCFAETLRLFWKGNDREQVLRQFASCCSSTCRVSANFKIPLWFSEPISPPTRNSWCCCTRR
jgi:hypothetical protein